MNMIKQHNAPQFIIRLTVLSASTLVLHYTGSMSC